MAKHGGNGGKGKNDTTENGGKISVSRVRARAKIDDKTWRKWEQWQKRHRSIGLGEKSKIKIKTCALRF